MVSAQNLGLVVVVGVLVVGVLAVFLYLSRRLRRRRDEILSQLKDKPALVQDRAFNRLEMARREATVVGRTGADVTHAQDLIGQSQAAFDQRQFARSYELAQSAHESLVNARQRPSATGPLPSPRSPAVPPPSGGGRSASAGATAAAPPSERPPLARNRAESHFALSLLDADLENAQRERPTAGPTLEAAALRTQSRAAFDRADYTEAFRLALRGRRTLGGKVESLAAAPASRATAPGGAIDAEGTAEQVAAGERCPNCGYPTTAADAFCRGCGTPRTPTSCPSCGASRTPTDTFCGRCGTRFSA
jgi:Double zinc ribbon